MRKYNHIDNAENLERKLKNIVKEVQEIEDPLVITEYKQFFKKHVSLFRRNFVAAYIIKKFLVSNTVDNTRQQKRNIPIQDKTLNKTFTSTDSQQKTKKIILKNISQNQCSKEELLTFLSSINGVEKKDILSITFQEKRTLISINPKILKAIIQGIKHTPFKDKKIYYSY